MNSYNAIVNGVIESVENFLDTGGDIDVKQMTVLLLYTEKMSLL